MKILISAIFISVLLSPTFASAKTADRVSEIKTEIASLQAKIKVLEKELAKLTASTDKDTKNEKKIARENKEKEANALFTLKESVTGQVDISKPVVLAEFKFVARKGEVSVASFGSDSYVYVNDSKSKVKESAGTINYTCTRDVVIRKDGAAICKISVTNLKRGEYGYVIKNPYISKVTGGSPLKTEFLLEGTISAR